MFGFIIDIASCATKVALTPLAVAKDILDGEPLETTSELLESAKDDLDNAFDDLM